jgi:2-keto-4-pentenoate hydratase
MGDQVMGDPLAAVSWLTGHVVSRGHTLAKGDVILTGSLTGHHRVAPAAVSVFEADFAELGRVQVRFHA